MDAWTDATSTSVQASQVAGGKDAFCRELLPQLLPLLTCPAMLRSSYGASQAAKASDRSAKVCHAVHGICE